MRCLVSGASGLIGRTIVKRLAQRGDSIVRLVRGGAGDGVSWDPDSGRIDLAGADGIDAVIHLAGENIASGRWSAERKRRILHSRAYGTRLLCECLANLRRPPRVFLCASAVGFYGDAGESERTEASPPGRGFLADVCAAWESACEAIRNAGVRVVHLRFGLVLARDGGALPWMLSIFRWCLGGRLGDGRQWVSWISLADASRAIEFLIGHESVTGPVNVVAPNAVRNVEFTRAIAAAVHRPAPFAVPAFVLRALAGEMAQELLLSGARVVPRVLDDRGFRFEQSTLDEALRIILAGEP